MKRRIMLTALAIAGSVGLYAPRAEAAAVYTSVLTSGEPIRELIFENSGIGDTTWAMVGLNYDDGAGVIATRMADARDDGGPRAKGSAMGFTGTVAADATDQEWYDGIARASAEAKFAGYQQAFGLFSGSTVTNKITVTPNGYNPVQTNIDNPFATGSSFKWGRAGNETDFTSLPWSSLEADNAGGAGETKDHMITYRMTSGGSFIGWMLFFDDQVPGGTDRDFNDLAVFVGVTEAVPLPAAAWMGMGLLGTIGGAGAIRKRRMRI